MASAATETKAETAAPVNTSPRTIRMDTRAMKPVQAPAPTKLYECGTTSECPRQNINVLGETFLEEIGHKVVRIYGHGRGDLYDDRSTQYAPAEGDARLSNYLWMREISEDGLKAESESPTTLSS